MPSSAHSRNSPWQIFLIFLRLGLTSFGGPIAHLGYFHEEFVTRRRWLSARSYADLVALCQFLPGPASSQVGIALGLSRSGYRGALAAWTGFTMPSAIAMILFALGMTAYGEILPAGILQGLKVVAVAVVAQAVWGMARTLCPDTQRMTIMAAATCASLWIPSAAGQVGVIVATGILGLVIFRPGAESDHEPLPVAVGHTAARFWLALFFALLIGLPLIAELFPRGTAEIISAFYRSGSLVFGGGHVVLPLLQAEVVTPGWVNEETFLAGYGAAQAVPGPLFTFAAFLGTAINLGPGGWMGGLLCLIAIFIPSFLLVAGTLPHWERLRQNTRARAALTGINAGVVGLLMAALYQPVWTSAIHRPQDFALGLAALVALVFWKLPPWLVVLGGAVGGWILA